MQLEGLLNGQQWLTALSAVIRGKPVSGRGLPLGALSKRRRCGTFLLEFPPALQQAITETWSLLHQICLAFGLDIHKCP
jgi:hypothetical protein